MIQPNNQRKLWLWPLLLVGLGAAACDCPDLPLYLEPRAMEVAPPLPGWPDNLQCCGETGRYDVEFAANYSRSEVALSWSSPKRLDVAVTLRSCVKRDPGDCALARVVDNENAPGSDGFFRGEYKVTGNGIRIGVTLRNPEPTSAKLGLRASERGIEMRPSDSCYVL